MTSFRALCAELIEKWDDHTDHDLLGVAESIEELRTALANAEPASTTEDSSATTPPAEGTYGPSIEELGSLIAWLNEEAGQAANAYAAGMLRWAAEIVSERVDEDAPDPATPPADGEVAELVEWLTMLRDRSAGLASDCYNNNLSRIIALLQQRYLSPTPPADGEVAELVELLKLDAKSARNTGALIAAATLTRAAELLKQRLMLMTPPAKAEPTPPAEGEVEVEELSVVHATAPERIWLYLNGANEYLPFTNEDDVIWSRDPIDSSDIPYIRADLLQQRHPVPIAVSERPPGLKDCNTEGQCWQEEPGSHTEPPGWYLTHYRSIIQYGRGRWLPLHSLPMPAEEGS